MWDLVVFQGVVSEYIKIHFVYRKIFAQKINALQTVTLSASFSIVSKSDDQLQKEILHQVQCIKPLKP